MSGLEAGEVVGDGVPSLEEVVGVDALANLLDSGPSSPIGGRSRLGAAAGGGVLGLGCDEFDIGATELVAGVAFVPEPGRLDGALSVPVLDPGRLHTSVSVGDSIPERCVGGVGDGQPIGGDGETLLESLAVLARAIVGVPRFIELSSGGCPQTVEPDRRFASHAPLPTGGDAGSCRRVPSGPCAARVRRWVVAGMSARSMARIASRTSRASATSSLSVTTQTRFSSRPRVAATYRPRRVVAGEARATGGVDGVGLVAVFGRGVAEPDVLADVVGGQA